MNGITNIPTNYPTAWPTKKVVVQPKGGGKPVVVEKPMTFFEALRDSFKR